MAVNIHGKSYRLVAERVDLFHSEYNNEDTSIITEIIDNNSETVLIKATITIGSRTYTGHAQETYGSSMINNTSALENCETSAIGRALASAGFGGGEFASADEVAGAISQQNSNVKTKPPVKKASNNDFKSKDLVWDDDMRSNTLDFGKWKELSWEEVDDSYLKFLANAEDRTGAKNKHGYTNKQFAQAEIVHRTSDGATRVSLDSEKENVQKNATEEEVKNYPVNKKTEKIKTISNLIKINKILSENKNGASEFIRHKIGNRSLEEISEVEQIKLLEEITTWSDSKKQAESDEQELLDKSVEAVKNETINNEELPF